MLTLHAPCPQLNKAFQAEESPGVIYCISMQWFREWEAFVKGRDSGKCGPAPACTPVPCLQPCIQDRALHPRVFTPVIPLHGTPPLAPSSLGTLIPDPPGTQISASSLEPHLENPGQAWDGAESLRCTPFSRAPWTH